MRSESRSFSSRAELLLEQRVVVLQVVSEERERLDERAAPGHDLGPASGEQVQGGELLEHAHRIVGAEDVDGAGEADAVCALRPGSKDDGGCRDDIVRSVVLTDAEDVQPDPVGELDLLDEVAQPLLDADQLAGARVGCHLAEGVDAELHAASVPHGPGHAPVGGVYIRPTTWPSGSAKSATVVSGATSVSGISTFPPSSSTRFRVASGSSAWT